MKRKRNMVIRWMLIVSLVFSMFAPVIQAQDFSIEDQLLIAETPNLISNSGFEEPVLDNGKIPGWNTWMPRGDSVVSIVYGDARAGDYSGKITATEPSSTGALDTNIRVEAGKTYALSFWAKSKNVELEMSICACVRIQYYDGNRASTQPVGYFGNLSGTQDWTFFHFLIRAPANTVTFNIQPILLRGTGELWFDDISLTEVDINQPADFLHYDATVEETGVVNVNWATNHLPDAQPLFDVYRSTTSGFTPDDDTWIGSTGGTEYQDRSTASGKTYYYKVAFTSSDGEEHVISEEMEVKIPDELPGVQPAASFKVMGTINQAIRLHWDLIPRQRAATVNIYGDHDPITEESKNDAILVASISATSGEYVIDSELQSDLIKPYYALSVVDGDGNESALSSGKFLPRIFEERIGDGFAMMNFNAAVFSNGEVNELQNASGDPLRVLTAGGIVYPPWLFFDEYFDAEVSVTTDSVEVQYEQTNAVFTLGESTFTVDGQTQEMPVPLFSNNGVIYLPVVALAEAFGRTARTFDQLTVIAEREILDAFEADDELVEAGVQLLSFQPINRDDITDQDFHELKQKARNHLVGSEDNELSNEWIAEHVSQIASTGQQSWNQMNKDENANILFGNVFPTTTAEMTSQYNHLSIMALAYGTYGSELYQNEALKDDILYGLEWLYENLYGLDEIEGRGWRSIHDFNWWDWMVGVPTHLNNVMLIMEPEMDQADIEKYLVPYLHILEAMQSQRPIVSRNYYATQAAILLHDVDMMVSLLNDYDSMLASVEDGEGVQEDWVYIYQRVPQSGTYGVVSLLERVLDGYSLLSGSKFEVRSPYKYNLAMWIYHMFEPIMYKGGNMVMFGGRSFSRSTNEQFMGAELIAGMLDLIGVYGLDDDEKLKKIIKRHVTEENLRDILGVLNISQLTKLREVLEDHSIAPDDYEIAYVYYTGDRVVQHRDNYAFGIAMSSSRIPTYSSLNQENQKGWYTGDGMTYLYLDHDLYQFGNDYRRNVNPYHLPGVTNDTQEREAVSIRAADSPLSNQDFVGAAQLKDLYFTAAMSYESYHNDVPPVGNDEGAGGMPPLHDSSLVAKKAWFAFDEEIVALGTGINAEDGYEVATTVDNRRLIEVKERSPSDTEEPAIPYLIKSVTAVGSDGNLPINVVDGDYGSRWSYEGRENAWIQLELTESLPIGYFGISVYVGQNSAALFEIKVSDDEDNWTTVYEGATSGTTPELEAFKLEEVVEAKYIRLYGYGRTTGSAWNSYTEIQVYPPDDNLPLELKNTSLFETGAETIVADGKLLEFENDSTVVLTDAEWVALENNAGYYFPNGGDLTVAKLGNTTKFMELRLHHGVDPDGEEYSYVLLPHKNDLETAGYASDPDVSILANTEQVQAVKDRSTGATGIVFWEAGTFGDITVSDPMIVMIQEKDGQFELSLSDPTQKLHSASVTINRSLETVKNDQALIY
ncbi:polysaccharide lyase family 8 super-sandwich domain-containing protein [Paenibacillus sp. J2TS4]|uniref:polysaccharide lyase family 8 super-sandwich domain-containing protein n=1 Tax=Paenibacillus sp. J2TS4 TaxID=2807194 RepID=UPI001B02B73E|nr:polysaccharide lyase family 8 super-sandwich domain-containing protein [Paenibacillus sp. J2TS4]GIP33996.1 hypothetical protein J2TS4_32060 [Paenibacillus sp. J2TS4]